MNLKLTSINGGLKIEVHENSSQKSGITTGSVATAASVAALLKLVDKAPDIVKITAPTTTLTVEIEDTSFIDNNTARAIVKKPNYNDPDVTRGMELSLIHI